MSTRSTQDSQHFAAVDGLRGIACLAVVAHHCYIHCGRYQWPTLNLSGRTVGLSRVLYYGCGGVELFFVVSGFCLAYPYCSRPEVDRWQRWFAKRAYRILPPYYASIVLFWGLAQVLRAHRFSLFGMTTPVGVSAPLKGLFVSITLLNVYFNPSYWTLVLEARWYLLFPMLMALWQRCGRAWLLATTFLASAVAMWWAPRWPRFDFVTGRVLLFLPIFGLGMVVAGWTADRRTPPWLVRNSRWGLLASAVLVGLTAPSDMSEGFLPPVVSWGCLAFFALLAALNDPLLSRLARTPALVGVGAFSYSLYLIHEPIVHLAYAMFSQLHLKPGEQLFVYELVVLPFCVAFGYLFYRTVERPLMRQARFVFKRASGPVRPAPVVGTTDR